VDLSTPALVAPEGAVGAVASAERPALEGVSDDAPPDVSEDAREDSADGAGGAGTPRSAGLVGSVGSIGSL
jgi:hypothetical protein